MAFFLEKTIMLMVFFFRKETFFDGVFLEKKFILMPFLACGRINLLHAAPDPN